MELIKKNIHMSREKGEYETQVTLNEDYALGEGQPGIERILMQQQDVLLTQAVPKEERVELTGRVHLELLYLTAEPGRMERLEMELPFCETINCAGMSAGDSIRPEVNLEDASVKIIHSAKLEAGAVLNLKVKVKTACDAMAALVPENPPKGVSFLQKQMEVLQLRISRKDTFRIKEEFELGSGKPAIGRILWKTMELRSLEIKAAQDRLLLRGELLLFVMYEGEEPHIPLQWLEQTLHFSGEVLINGCMPEMIPDVRATLTGRELTIGEDYEGERRQLVVDAVLDLQMDLYEEERLSILNDVYSPSVQMVPEVLDGYFENLLVKNNARCKINEKAALHPNSRILQICHSGGEWRLDRVSRIPEGLLMEGAVLVSLLYMTTDDNEPLQMQKTAVPFSYTLEVPNMTEETIYHVRPGLEQLSTVLLGTDEVEVRAGLSFDTMVVRLQAEPVIVSVREEPLDPKELERIPGMIGYVVGEHDTLWEIAKKFHTTMEHIRSCNKMTAEQVTPGDRLLIVKEAGELLDAHSFRR